MFNTYVPKMAGGWKKAWQIYYQYHFNIQCHSLLEMVISNFFFFFAKTMAYVLVLILLLLPIVPDGWKVAILCFVV